MGTALREQLVAAVLRGEKTATAGLLVDYEQDGEPLPEVGERLALVDNEGATSPCSRPPRCACSGSPTPICSSRATRARASSRSRTGAKRTILLAELRGRDPRLSGRSQLGRGGRHALRRRALPARRPALRPRASSAASAQSACGRTYEARRPLRQTEPRLLLLAALTDACSAASRSRTSSASSSGSGALIVFPFFLAHDREQRLAIVVVVALGVPEPEIRSISVVASSGSAFDACERRGAVPSRGGSRRGSTGARA